jgi:hypothetical protein
MKNIFSFDFMISHPSNEKWLYQGMWWCTQILKSQYAALVGGSHVDLTGAFLDQSNHHLQHTHEVMMEPMLGNCCPMAVESKGPFPWWRQGGNSAVPPTFLMMKSGSRAPSKVLE